jgi:hypothetical protein
VGNVLPVPLSEVAEARKLYLSRYANSKYWVDFEDFSFYRMDVVDIYYVGGFGVMGWVSASEYTGSEPDPLAESMAEISTACIPGAPSAAPGSPIGNCAARGLTGSHAHKIQN